MNPIDGSHEVKVAFAYPHRLVVDTGAEEVKQTGLGRYGQRVESG
jgi:hypothetical protein